MPYYVYSIRSFGRLELREQFDAFRDASAHAKVLRGALAADSGEQIKVIFAESEDQAVELLCQPRTPQPQGDD
jgi:hypothetical protein